MYLSDLPYPLRLCVELLAYARMSCPKTQDMAASEIKFAVATFFDEPTIAEALDILSGEGRPPESAIAIQSSQKNEQGATSGVREICTLVIDSYDLEVAGVNIPDDQLSDFEEFLQDQFWDEVDLVGLLQKVSRDFKYYR